MVLKIDPRLPLLPVEDAEYEERVETNSNEASDSSVVAVGTDPDDVSFEFAEEDYAQSGLEPPANVTVISQTVKVGSGGASTVDIVIEIDDVTGASEYERRESS